MVHGQQLDIQAMADTSSAADGSETVEVSFHNVSYSVTVSTINGDTMSIDVEQRSDASRWRGDFTSRYIEDITAKTGNFKKFPVFVKMLLSALKQASDSVFVDLLTYQDLEVLKARKAGGAGQPARPLAPNNKRYLILTYAAEFDRVHYPLPLLFDDNPDPQHLRNIISSLRAELEAVRVDQVGSQRSAGASSGAVGREHAMELRRLREENSALRQQVRHWERSGAGPAAGRSDQDTEQRQSQEVRELAHELRMVRKERDLLQARVEGLDVELERERGQHRRELRRKAKETQEVYEELSRYREQVRQLKEQLRQLQDQLDSRRPLSASDRLRHTYSRGPEPGTSGRSYSRPSSRNNSRGTSPSSRAPPGPSHYHSSSSYSRPPQYDTHRTRDTGYRSTTSSQPPSRPNSAPAARSPASGRFDPTEYVRQQREALAARRASGGSASSSRAPTPPRSHVSSGHASPVASRGAYSGMSRGVSPSTSRPVSHDGAPAAAPRRPGSVERIVRPLSGDGGLGPRSRAASPGGGWSKFPVLNPGQPGRGVGAVSSSSRPQSAERAQSPGRALQEVKRKLSEYVTKRSSDGLSTTSSYQASDMPSVSVGQAPLPSSSSQQQLLPNSSATQAKAQLFNDASAEIADIDERLHALQNFLRMAKASAPQSVNSQPSTASAIT